MASLQAQGGAPVSITDSQGVQYFVPLSLITFPSATGTPDASAWLSGFTSAKLAVLKPVLSSWLQTLAGQGLLAASAVSATPPAFTVVARDGGSTGNDVTVTIANVVPNGSAPGQTTADVTVSTSQTYAGLTLATISAVLGTSTQAGSQPGLAQVSSVGTALPTATTTALSFTGTPLQLAVPAASGTAFTLVPTHTEKNASLLKASIAAVDTTKNTFTLTLSWTLAATQLALSSLNSEFGYLVTITPPPSGFAYPPAANTYTLQGGADPSSIASATVAQAVVAAG